ncbi:unnamed protein product [Closterium sp. Yama58-4]|nr:unnamed protein product [Closterium sp. Yama58-4]
MDDAQARECCKKCAKQEGCRFWRLKPAVNGQLGECKLLSSLSGITVRNWDVPIVPSYPIANLPGTATSLDEESLAAALEAAANEKKPRHIRQLEQERLSAEELSELERMRANGSLPLTDEVAAALEREVGGGSGGEEEKQHSIQYGKHELKARLLKGKAIRSWIRELQVMWRDEAGSQHSAFIKARDGKEQGRGSSGFIDRLELDGSPVAPPLSAGSAVVGSGGFKLLLAETRSRKGKDEDEFHLTIDGVVDMGMTARLAHPLMQTASEAQAHFNVHIDRLNSVRAVPGWYKLPLAPCILGARFGQVMRGRMEKRENVAWEDEVGDGEEGV